MTASNANNVVLTKDSITVTVQTTEDEENLTKALTMITPPKATKDQSTASGANDTLIVDLLLKAEQRITVDGYLVNDDTGGTDTSDDAQGKKVDLKKIFLGGGIISMTYEGSSVSINMDKLSIKRVNKEGVTEVPEVAEFSVKFTAIKGVDL